MEEFEVIVDLAVRTVVIFGAPYLIGALIGYSLRSIFSGGKSKSAVQAAAVGAVAGAGAAALVETPKTTTEPQKTEEDTTVDKAELTEVSEKQESETPAEKTEPEKAQETETTAAIEEVSNKEEVAKTEDSEEKTEVSETPEVIETSAIEEVAQKEVIAEAEQTAETVVQKEVVEAVAAVEEQQPEPAIEQETVLSDVEQVAQIDPNSVVPAAAKEKVEEVSEPIPQPLKEDVAQPVNTAESVVEQVEAIARPDSQEQSATEEPVQVEEVAEVIETPAEEEVSQAEPESAEPEAVEAVAEIGEAESPIGDVEAVAKIDPNSIVPAAAGTKTAAKEEVAPKVPDLGPLADLPPSGESVLEQVEAIAHPEGKPEKKEEPEVVEAQEVVVEATEETVEEVAENVEAEQVVETTQDDTIKAVSADETPAEIKTANAMPETVDIAQAVEVEEVAAPLATAQVTELLSAEADETHETNGQSKDSLISTSNKGRVIGNEMPDDIDLDIADLTDSEYARLSKDLPVNKTTVMPSRASQAHDLKQIKGIGVIAETQLNGIGIESIHQIADWSEADIDAVDSELNAGGRVRSERWVEQARFLTDKKIK